MEAQKDRYPLRKLKLAVRRLKDWSFNRSFHWSTIARKSRVKARKYRIRVVPLDKLDWVAFIFPCSVQINELFQQVPKLERFFYKERINCYCSFCCWAVRSSHLQTLLEETERLHEVELEFITLADRSGQRIPCTIFEPLHLKFYPAGDPCSLVL